MAVPIPIRKWLIRRWRKQQEAENATSRKDTETPLTQAEKARFQKDSKKVLPSPLTTSVRSSK